MRAHERLPLVTVRVREQVAVPCSASQLWEFVTDLRNDRAIIGQRHVQTFVVPGTPVGEVGEVQCTVLRRADGSWQGQLGETVERVEGRRLSVRSWSESHGHVETVTVAQGELAWEVAVETHPEHVETVRERCSAALVEQLGRVAALLAGEVPAEADVPYVAGCADGGSIVEIETSATVELTASADEVWSLVSDAKNIALDASDPAAVSFTVPGSRQGEVGEVVCVITATVGGGRIATFQQVVGLRPGGSIVLRGLSTVAEHAWEREITVEPVPGGARVTNRARIPVHQHKVRASRVEFGRGAERYLRVVAAELVPAA